MPVYIAGVAGFGLVLWYARKEPLPEGLSDTRIQQILKPLYCSILWLCRKLHLPKPQDLMTKGVVLLMLLTGNIAALAVAGVENHKARIPVKQLEKGGYEAPYEQTMKVEDRGKKVHDITILVPGRTYSEKELEVMLTEAVEGMEQYILGENESLGEVHKDLNLVSVIAGTPIQVTWTTEQPDYLDWEGRLGSNIPEAGAKVKILGSLFCQGKTKEYIQLVKVFPERLSEAQMWQKKILNAIKQNNENKDSEQLVLPGEVDGEPLFWFKSSGSNSLLIVGITAVMAVVLLVGRSREQVLEGEKRKAQMMQDYPNILSKFILLLNAGMSMRKAFAKAAMDYKKQKELSGKSAAVRYAYEEILLVYYEMEKGVSEREAYERLGLRCGLPGYKSFSVMLVQNLRKGNKKMLEIMEQEARTAFEDRKRRAKVQGELAGTKLLLPMGGMLIIVFAILLIPAFLNFSL